MGSKPWVHRGGEAWEGMGTILDGKFNADTDKIFKSRQMPTGGSSLPSLASAELAPSHMCFLGSMSSLPDICSSPEIRFSPFCHRVSSKHLPGPAPS